MDSIYCVVLLRNEHGNEKKRGGGRRNKRSKSGIINIYEILRENHVNQFDYSVFLAVFILLIQLIIHFFQLHTTVSSRLRVITLVKLAMMGTNAVDQAAFQSKQCTTISPL